MVPPPGFNKFYSNWDSNLYGIRKFYGYKAHFNYLDYFVKTDVAMREGQMHPSSGGMQKQQQKQEKKEGGNEETPQV